MSKIRGFTLIELLVVISILAILAVVGAALYSGVSKSSRDSKRKADIQAIAKAYETNYQNGSYQTLATANFAAGTIPQDPAGGNYFTSITSDNSAFRVCTALENNPLRTCSSPSTNCYCLTSTQGSYTSGSGGSLDHPSSCDPNGTLSYGLVGYWRMDEGSGSTATNQVNNNNTISLVDGPSWTTPGKYNSAISVDGLNDRLQGLPSDPFEYTGGDITYSLWFKPNSSDIDVGRILSKPWNGNGQYNYWLYLNSSNQVSFAIHNGSSGSNQNILTSDTSLTDGQWSHLAVVINGGTKEVVLYIDNNSKSATHNITNFNPSTGDQDTSLSIGCLYPYGSGWAGNTTFCVRGDVDDIRYYSRTLNTSEIDAIKNGCVPSD